MKLPDICFDKYQLQLHVIGSYYGQPQRVLSLNLPHCNLQICQSSDTVEIYLRGKQVGLDNLAH